MGFKNYQRLIANKQYLMSVLFLCFVSFAGATTQYIRWGTSKDFLNGLNVTWNGSGTADSIQWGYTAAFEKGKFLAQKRAASPLSGNIFFYDFGNSITPSATIYYKIKDSSSPATWGAQRTKNTVPAATVDGVDFTFCAAGDSRGASTVWKNISDRMAAHNPICAVFNGDITATGSVGSEWTTWYSNATNLNENVPMLHAEGNHESPTSYLNQFNLPKNGNNTNYSYYSVIYGNVIFITLDAEIAMAPQNTWLDAQLAAAKAAGIKWSVISWHEPYYTNGSHAGEMTDWSWWTTFDKYGVDLIFNGHDHCYERTKPINRTVSTTAPVSKYGSGPGEGRLQIVCGGAGAPLYDGSTTNMLEKYTKVNNYVKCDVTGCVNNTTSITITAYNGSGAVIDNIVLAKSCNSTTGVNEPMGQIFNPMIVSPNPVTGKFNLKYSSDIQGEAFIEVSTLEGKVIKSTTVNKSGLDLEYNGDLSGLAKGGYYISVIMGSQRDNALILLK